MSIWCFCSANLSCFCYQIVDELRDQILKLRFPHRVQNKEATPKTKRKAVGHPSPSKSPSLPAPKPALSDRPCVVVLNKPLEKLLIRSVLMYTDISPGPSPSCSLAVVCHLLAYLRRCMHADCLKGGGSTNLSRFEIFLI